MWSSTISASGRGFGNNTKKAHRPRMAEVGKGGTSEDLPRTVHVLTGMYQKVFLGTSSNEPLPEEQQCQKARAPGSILGDFHAHDVQGTAQEDHTADSTQGGCPVTVPLAKWVHRDDREKPCKDEGKDAHKLVVQGISPRIPHPAHSLAGIPRGVAPCQSV